MLKPLQFTKSSILPAFVACSNGELTYPDLDEIITEILPDGLSQLVADFPDVTLVSLAEVVEEVVADYCWVWPEARARCHKTRDLKRRVRIVGARLGASARQHKLLFAPARRNRGPFYAATSHLSEFAGSRVLLSERWRLFQRVLVVTARRTYKSVIG